MLKIAILAEKFAEDYTWYVDTILNLIRLAGDYVSEEVWFRIIQIVINRQDVQGYAAKTCFEVCVCVCVCLCICTGVHVHCLQSWNGSLSLSHTRTHTHSHCKLQLVTRTWSRLVAIFWESLVISLLAIHDQG